MDVLFRSVAEQVGANAVGRAFSPAWAADGARGLQECAERGALTIAQDESSSVVWGMPGAAVALGAVERVLPIEQIARGLVAQGDDGRLRKQRRAPGS